MSMECPIKTFLNDHSLHNISKEPLGENNWDLFLNACMSRGYAGTLIFFLLFVSFLNLVCVRRPFS